MWDGEVLLRALLYPHGEMSLAVAVSSPIGRGEQKEA